MSHDPVLTTIDKHGVATVTLNNPELHNAFDDQSIATLTQTFNQLASDSRVKVMMLAANGKSFSAGANLNWMKRMATYSYDENLQDARALAAMLNTLNSFPKPTLARVQGATFGGGVGLVSCCDIAIASNKASFCLSEVKLGIVPATISPYVIAAIGSRASRRYFTTAERFNADTALRLGLISECVEAAQLDTTIAAIIDSLLVNGPEAVTKAKQLVTDVSHRPIDAALIDETCQLIAEVRSSTEGREGLTAFLEKRPASWLQAEKE